MPEPTWVRWLRLCLLNITLDSISSSRHPRAAVLHRDAQLGRIVGEVKNQDAVCEASAGVRDILIAIEEPTLDVCSIDGDIRPKWNLDVVDPNGRAP
jgi:hypothetical protein